MKRRRSSSFFDECLGKLFADLIDASISRATRFDSGSRTLYRYHGY